MRSDAPTSPVRVRRTSSDLREVAELLRRSYGAVLTPAEPAPGPWRAAFEALRAGPIAAADVALQLEASVELHGRGDWVFGVLRGGRVGYERSGREDRFAPGDVYVGVAPGDEGRVHLHDARFETVSLPASLLQEVVREHPEHAARPWTFTLERPTRAGGLRWRRTLRAVRGVLEDPAVREADLVVGPAARLLAATALAVFPNDAFDAPVRVGEHDAHPRTLRRAVAFIEGHPDRDLSLADVAAAAHVTTRAVQLAFRRHLDTTPMAYLRRVRLEHARRQLLDADPQDGTTVSRVAVDWGFGNPGRFAAYYRAAYDERPSDTLAR